MRDLLRLRGYNVGRRHVGRLMRLMGIEALYRKKRTSKKNPEHKVYPYLLRNLVVERANDVWCTDISYIPMREGFLYLIAVLDWATRKVLTWRLSNSLTTDFCVDALEDAIATFGRPKIFNTDQGCQLPIPLLPTFSRTTGSRSAWTAKVLGVTTYLLSAFGDQSSTRKYICALTNRRMKRSSL